ncbi:aldehyde dehydrogenase, partial [Bacillus cereus]
MLIGAQWVEAADGQTKPLHNPATGEPLCVVPRATVGDVDRAVLAARQAFDDSPWSRTRPRERQNLLWKLADLMQRDAELLA